MSLRSELYEARCRLLKPAPKLDLVEWAESYRYLSKESSSEPGLFNTSRVEVARGPMLAVTDPKVEKISIMAPTQLFKALCLDTEIPMADGNFVTIRDLEPGDIILDEDAQPCRVVGKSELEKNTALRVDFSDGTHVVCDPGHRWQVRSLHNKHVKVLTAKTILLGMTESKRYDVLCPYKGGYRYLQIDKITLESPRYMQCIKVDSPSSLFLCTRAYIPTHNTETLNNCVGYFMHQDPAPIILMQPTIKLGEAWSKERLDPMIRDCPAIKEKVSEKKRDSKNTITNKHFTGGFIAIVGANAPADLAMRPCRVILCDEVDKYPASAGEEGDPIKLLTERSATFWNRKIILTCSPTIKGMSRIEQSYLESDQRIYKNPCPNCKEFIEMQWEHVEWEGDDPDTARYVCPECSHKWTEPQRLRSIKKGRWEATKPFKGHAGFNCSKLVSPWEPIKRLVKKYLEAKDKDEQLKTFVNTNLGRTWREPGEAPDWEVLYERRSHYKRRVVPPQAVFVTAGVDCQLDRLELEIVAWGPNKQSWSLDYIVIDGSPTDEKTWGKLEALLGTELEIEGCEHTIAIQKVAVDSGAFTQDVYYHLKRFPWSRVFPVKGFDKLDTIAGIPKAVDVRWNGKKISQGQKLWPMGSSHIKSELYVWLNKLGPKDGEEDPYGYCRFPQYDAEYFKMLTAEQKQKKIVRGYPKDEWVKLRPRNEALDCRVMARMAASICGLDRMKKDRLEKMTLARPYVTFSASDLSDDYEDSAPKTEKEPQKVTKKKKTKRKVKKKTFDWS